VKIDPFIEAGVYRTVLWNLRIEEDALKIGISKVKIKGSAVDIAGTKVRTSRACRIPLPTASSSRHHVTSLKSRFWAGTTTNSPQSETSRSSNSRLYGDTSKP